MHPDYEKQIADDRRWYEDVWLRIGFLLALPLLIIALIISVVIARSD